MPRPERTGARVRVLVLLAACVLAVLAGRTPAMGAPEQDGLTAPAPEAQKSSVQKSPGQKSPGQKSTDQKPPVQKPSTQKPCPPASPGQKPSTQKSSGPGAPVRKAVQSAAPKQAGQPVAGQGASGQAASGQKAQAPKTVDPKTSDKKAADQKAADQKAVIPKASPPKAADPKTADTKAAGPSQPSPALKGASPAATPAASAARPAASAPAKAAASCSPPATAAPAPKSGAPAAPKTATSGGNAPAAATAPKPGASVPSGTAAPAPAAASAPPPAASAAPGKDHPFETGSELDARRILPPELFSGPDHQVEEAVENDGYLNTYTVKSRFGEYKVTSNYLLAVRVGEFKAMEVMDKGVGIKEFGLGVWQGGVSLVTGVKDLVLHPVDTMKSAASGVGKLFSRTEEGISGSPSSKYEDSTGAKMIGYASTRREYAKTFGVDPYSANQPMQKRLDSLARAGYAGGLTSMGLKALIPGGIGIAVSSVSGVNWLGEVDVAQPPADMRMANREALAAMGVDNATILRFMDNGEYTPTCQSLLVHALKALGRTGGMSAFVRQAARATGPDQALFRQRMAQMYAAYGAKVAAVEGFLTMGNLVGARAADGALVICLPVDHLCWTEGLALMAEAARPLRDTARGGVVQLWAAGTVSDLAKRVLTARGWQVREDAAQELMGEKLFVK